MHEYTEHGKLYFKDVIYEFDCVGLIAYTQTTAGQIIMLCQKPYIDDDCEETTYKASATDNFGNDYMIEWRECDPKCEDHGDVCDWEHPCRFILLGNFEDRYTAENQLEEE